MNILPVQKVEIYILKLYIKNLDILFKHTAKVQNDELLPPFGYTKCSGSTKLSTQETHSALLTTHHKTSARVHCKNEITLMRNPVMN